MDVKDLFQDVPPLQLGFDNKNRTGEGFRLRGDRRLQRHQWAAPGDHKINGRGRQQGVNV